MHDATTYVDGKILEEVTVESRISREARELIALVLVQFSQLVMSSFLKPHGMHHARLPCPSPTPRACSNSCPSSHPTISSSVVSSCLQSFPTSQSFPVREFFTSGGQSMELQLQHQPFQWIFRTDFLEDWLVWSYSPRDSQESSPTPQLKSINSSVLNFLYAPTFTSLNDYWKNHSFELDGPL